MDFHHKCGIGSCYKDSELKTNLYKLAISLNHRGEEGTGFCVDVGSSFLVSKESGLVRDVFNRLYKQVDFKSDTGFIHNRYSTAGSSSKANLQPIHVGKVAVAHNGTLINTVQLREKYSKKYNFNTETDTELIGCIFDDAGGDLLEGAKRCFDECIGSYNLIVMNKDGDMVVIRDPWAIHPFFWNFDETNPEYPVFTASEDCALRTLGIYDDKKISEVPPGYAAIFRKKGGITTHPIRTGERLQRDFFEPLYFMSYASSHKGKLVSDIRIELGMALGRKLQKKGIKADIIGVMRDSGADYAEGVHRVLDLPIVDIFGRNRYVGRTYMAPEDKGEEMHKAIKFTRQERAILKNPPIPSRVRGMSIVIPDDSKVRGNTSRGLNNELFRAGTFEIHEVVAAPPIRFPCFLGMDHAEKGELVAAGFQTLSDAENGVAAKTKATTTTYLDIDDVKPVINDENDHCWACIDSCYNFDLPLELKKKLES